MNTNQRIAIAAIIVFAITAFLAPSTYYDHKLNACIDSYMKMTDNNGGDDKFVKVTCIASVNGFK